MSLHLFPLYSLLDDLRAETAAGFYVGMEEYALIVKTLKAGFGHQSLEELEQVLRLLLIKNPLQEKSFAKHFKNAVQFYESLVLQWQQQEKPIPKETKNKADDNDHNNRPPENQSNDSDASTFVLPSAGQTSEMPRLNIPKNQDGLYLVSPEYEPATRKQLDSIFFALSVYARRKMPTAEIDVPASVEAVAQTGFFMSPVFARQKKKPFEVLMLLDHSDLMMPFARQTDDISGALRHLSVRTLYFKNYPGKGLYHNRAHTRLMTLPQLTQYLSQQTIVLIFSDAGAAKNNYSTERIEKTAEFLNGLGRYTKKIIWLNPLPATRWMATSAEAIAERQVSMYALDGKSLQKAIDRFKY